MKSTGPQLGLATLAALVTLAALPAVAATDTKILPGAICQPNNPADLNNLRYWGRGVEAVGKDVELVCPIVRDSTLSGLKRVEVRFQRGFDQAVVFNGVFHLEFLSCSDEKFANPCFVSKKHESPSGGNNPTSASMDGFDGVPMGSDRSFSIKTVLPRGTLLKSVRYTEKVTS